MATIDTHTHVWSAFSQLCEPRRYTPPYSRTMKQLFADMNSCGVDNAVLVQPSYLGTDNQYLLGMLELWPDRLRGVAVVDPMIREDSFAQMVAAGVTGVRLNLIGQSDPAQMLDGRYDALFDLLRRHDCHLEIQMRGPSWAQLLQPLLDRNLVLVADHFGLPENDQCEGTEALLCGLQSGNLWIKLSGVYRFNAAPGPLAKRLQAAGPSRLIWGSDYPWTQHEEGRTYEGCLMELSEWLPEQEQQILCDNPQQLYRF